MFKILKFNKINNNTSPASPVEDDDVDFPVNFKSTSVPYTLEMQRRRNEEIARKRYSIPKSNRGAFL